MAEPDETPVDPTKLTEHQLLEKIFEAFIVLQKSTKDMLFAWGEVLRTKRRTTMLVAIVLVMTIAQQWQLSQRGEDIADLKDSISDVRESVNVIRRVADDVEGNGAAQRAASARAVEQIDRICQKIDC